MKDPVRKKDEMGRPGASFYELRCCKELGIGGEGEEQVVGSKLHPVRTSAGMLPIWGGCDAMGRRLEVRKYDEFSMTYELVRRRRRVKGPCE